MSFVRSLSAAASDRFYVTLDATVFRFRRVVTDDLRRTGYAHLEGSGAAQRANAEANAARREEIAILQANAKTPEEREKTLAALREHDARVANERMKAVLSTPEGERAFLDRMTAYMVAAVDGCGLLEGGAQDGVPRVSEDCPDGVVIEACKLVTDERSADAEAEVPRVWVQVFGERRRIVIGSAIQQALDAAAEVLPFRVQRGHAAQDRPDLVGGRRPPKRDPQVGPVRRGAR